MGRKVSKTQIFLYTKRKKKVKKSKKKKSVNIHELKNPDFSAHLPTLDTRIFKQFITCLLK